MDLCDRITKTAQQHLHRALDMGIGKKALFISKSVSGIISHFADTAFLKEHGCEMLAYLSDTPVDVVPYPTVIFIMRAHPRDIKLFSAQVKALLYSDDNRNETNTSEKRFYLFCLPRTSLLCKQILEDDGILANTEVHDLDIDFVPLESDLLSLELPCLRDITVAQDYSAIYQLAHSTLVLETGIGQFSCVRGRGLLAQRFIDIYTAISRSFPSNIMPPSNNTLILIDRTIDLVTPLMTPQTYTGLLDYFRDIQCGFIEVDIPNSPRQNRKLKLSKRDDLVYNELVDLHFDAAGLKLKDLAVSIRTQNDELQKTESISDINRFVDKLPEIIKAKEMLSIHIRFAELLHAILDKDYIRYLETEQGAASSGTIDTEFVDELIWSRIDANKALILICLVTHTCNVRDKQLESWRNEFLQSYGYQYQAVWRRLVVGGVIRSSNVRPQYGNTSWSSLRRALHLVQEDVEINQPISIAYSYSGYSPLSVRIVQELMGTGTILPPLPGPKPTISMPMTNPQQDPLYQVLPVPIVEYGVLHSNAPIYIAFLGGITFAEVSAIRLLSKLAKRSITILTTDIITPPKMISSFI